jgi:hypothetical protein
MKRVTYNETKFTCFLDAGESEADNERRQKELSHLGSLFNQKEGKTF